MPFRPTCGSRTPGGQAARLSNACSTSSRVRGRKLKPMAHGCSMVQLPFTCLRGPKFEVFSMSRPSVRFECQALAHLFRRQRKRWPLMVTANALAKGFGTRSRLPSTGFQLGEACCGRYAIVDEREFPAPHILKFTRMRKTGQS